jgi:hypothetical protein
MIKNFKEQLNSYGFDIDPYYSFFLQWELDKLLQHRFFFQKEDLDFAFSNISIPWASLYKDLQFVGVKCPTLSEFSEKFAIDYHTDQIIIEEIYSIEKMMKFLKEAYIHDPLFQDGFIQIGVFGSPQSARIMYSMRQMDLGSIWMELPDETFITKLSDNIILFLNEGNISIHEGNIVRFGASINGIHKMWGKNYWEL